MAESPKSDELLDQYDVQDPGIDPDLDLPPEPPKKSVVKDPKTGRFVKAKQEVEPPPAPPAPKHPNYILRRAEKLGVMPEEAAEMSPEDLRKEIDYRIADRDRELKIRGVEQALNNPETGNPAPYTAPPVKKADPDAFTEEELESLSEYAPVLAKAVRYVAKHAEKLEAIEGKVGGLEQFQQRQQDQAALNWLDKRFSQRPEIYGTGATEDLDPGSSEYAKRAAVVNQLKALPKAHRTTPQADFTKIDSLLFGSRTEPKPKTEPTPETAPRYSAEEWENGQLPRPSNRQTPDLPYGTERATRSVAALLRERSTNGRGDEEQDLPG